MTAPELNAASDPEDPYTVEGSRLAVHTPQPTALALRSELGRLLLDAHSEFVALAKASGLEPERLVLELVAVARKKPEILKCTHDSIMTFMFDAAKTGLVIGRGCFPVPVNDNSTRPPTKRLECWIGYKGMKELVVYGGTVRDVFAQVRFEGDHWLETLGLHPTLEHRPGPHFGDMSRALGVYAVALFRGGLARHKYFSREKIEEYRKMNRADTTKASSPWVSHTEEMWKAKAILRLASDLPQNPRLAHALHVVDRDEDGAVENAFVNAQAPAESVGQLPPMRAITSSADSPADVPPRTMSLREALTVPVRIKGGGFRTMAEHRNTGLAALQAWAREGLEKDPEHVGLQRIATAAGVVLEARARAECAEPPRRQQG